MDGIICVYKPEGFTSFDVVAKCRGILRERRVGHGGTLDPMATGVLPLFLGRATTAADLTFHQEKAYVAGLFPGLETDTYDVTGTVLARHDASGVTEEDVRALLPRFTGTFEQTPPLFSAVQVDGERLYKAAHKGRERSVRIPSRTVTVHELDVFSENGALFLRIRCSKGTYVRSIIHDLGKLLGCGAAMSSLLRTESCGFTLEDCVTIDQLQAARDEGQPERWLMPVEVAFRDMRESALPEDRLLPFLNGLPTYLGRGETGVRAVRCGGRFLGLGRLEADGQLYPEKFFVNVETLRTECRKDPHAAV